MNEIASSTDPRGYSDGVATSRQKQVIGSVNALLALSEKLLQDASNIEGLLERVLPPRAMYPPEEATDKEQKVPLALDLDIVASRLVTVSAILEYIQTHLEV